MMTEQEQKDGHGAIDPIRLEVIRNALVAAAEEMSVAIARTSRSPSVREILDYSTAVFDADGNNVAQSSRIPVHLNSMSTCLETIIDRHIPVDAWQPGDVIVTNDPYHSGGQHLPDIIAFKPVFAGDQRIAIAGTLCHHIDMGGGAPGSYDPGATEIFREGLRIPAIKIVERGKRNAALIEIIALNVREPEMVAADIIAQIAALDIGAAGIGRLVDKFGPAIVSAATNQIQLQSELAMRRAISAMPDGTFTFEDFVDGDGIVDEPIRISAAVTIDTDTISVDLSGSAAQVRGPVNCTLNMSKSAVYYAIMSATGGDIPPNAGCYRPITVHAPAGSVVNANHPASVANRMAVGHRIVNTVLGAMSQALPQRIPAAYYGVSYVYTIEPVLADGRRQVYFEIEVGGWGAAPTYDGPNALSAGFHNLANAPIEIIESSYPITFTTYGLRVGSGGQGQYRGGLGLVREWRLDAPVGRFNSSFERFRFAPYGLAGGEPGATGRLTLQRNGKEQVLDAKERDLELQRGDVLRLETSGGGGFGSPQDRNPQAVRFDIENGYVANSTTSQ